MLGVRLMKRKLTPRALAMTAMLGALASVLMFVQFPIPFLIPSFIEMDVSELPALIAAFALGPWYGVAVCLIKNLVHLTVTTTGGVGEIANFLLGTAFLLPAGYLYRRKKNRVGALLGSIVGAVAMAALSFPINLYLTYPIYTQFMPLETILGMYRELIPAMDSLEMCLLVFNVPFTLLKGAFVTLLTFLVYKPLSRFIKGK